MAMSVIDIFALVIVCAVALISPRGNPRSLIWLAALAADYFLSGAYWRAGMAQPELVAGLCDAAVCLALWRFGAKIWEMRVLVLFLSSLFVNFVFLAHNLSHLELIDHEVYSIVLEVLNVLAVCFIGAASAGIREKRTDGRAYNTWSPSGRAFLSVFRKDTGRHP